MEENKKPYKEGYLPHSDGHEVYFAAYGNSEGPHILSVHGGPGSQSKASHVDRLDTEKYSVILFDQRGCGKSLPLGSIENNTTELLVSDMERLREHLNIDEWFVVGGSWGSTLALAYAQANPSRVRGLLLHGVWLGREKDVDWSLAKKGGAELFFPDVWEERMKFLKRYDASPKNAAGVLLQKLIDGDEKTVADIVAGVTNWETNLFAVTRDVQYRCGEDISEGDIAYVKMFLHYEANAFFLSHDQLLENVSFIKDIPTVIVHGRYDVVCPMDQAWELKKNLNNVDFVVVPSSGHLLSAEGNRLRYLAFNSALEKWTR